MAANVATESVDLLEVAEKYLIRVRMTQEMPSRKRIRILLNLVRTKYNINGLVAILKCLKILIKF